MAGRRDLAIAIAGEIAAFLDLTERLDTIARARAAIAAIKAGERVDPQQLLFDDIARWNRFRFTWRGSLTSAASAISAST